MNCANGCDAPCYRQRSICIVCIAAHEREKRAAMRLAIPPKARGRKSMSESMQKHYDNMERSHFDLVPAATWNGWDHARSCALLKMPILCGSDL